MMKNRNVGQALLRADFERAAAAGQALWKHVAGRALPCGRGSGAPLIGTSPGGHPVSERSFAYFNDLAFAFVSLLQEVNG